MSMTRPNTSLHKNSNKLKDGIQQQDELKSQKCKVHTRIWHNPFIFEGSVYSRL